MNNKINIGGGYVPSQNIQNKKDNKSENKGDKIKDITEEEISQLFKKNLKINLNETEQKNKISKPSKITKKITVKKPVVKFAPPKPDLTGISRVKETTPRHLDSKCLYLENRQAHLANQQNNTNPAFKRKLF
ncbi:MAG: hypothetical protein COZ46_01960 [Verrucomicrobia bacterium CG_4_10_14_3_um_filter_43_23]|nr:MAG: hypothetical protein AUJ82_01975 [Verrucomicrobia bacterium CG1_02_43_26]PIP59663.1 MAG: hypothetical protein COX01_03565 [Verrucomicrobia bacterium CG22_combo_CG10-13_8_21_14_all_43_17]PIX58962.1 MAG: hypothetical protein COZ46_01960 [Verrucomicrobia bacterium CG_4_10_14_3_um_filter_43_23]PIY63107.1 MAG: hypothetical protein COY94_00310 [Verrucomicrobia bacterium CG_4_10_14_0_8_um_filter_43_34]PJA43614.1 MAG: hypothetical protein CO175_07235 [Verrucomicrobia bacterium CG_4_9_14_3_um_fi